MKVYPQESFAAIDVDDTLVIHGAGFENEEGSIAILDPYLKQKRWVLPHKRHIRWIKKLHARGFGVTVWSHGGPLWAEQVVLALGLSDYVTKVEVKPDKIVDDLPLELAFGRTIYIPFKKGEIE